jgi:uncharacterized protein (DUF3084 family)
MGELISYFSVAFLLLIWHRLERTTAQIVTLHEQIDELRRELGFLSQLSATPSEQVKALAGDPTKTVEAIRTYRKESGVNLKDAAAVVNDLRKPHPDASQETPSK